MSFDLYQSVTDQIISILETGVVPWRSPILVHSASGMPQNLESTKPYRGVNLFLLAFTAWQKGFASKYWLTFNQAKAHGGTVKKGEKSSMVIFWKQTQITDEETGETKQIPILRYYNVFNVEQCHGIASADVPATEPREFEPIEAAEKIARGYADGPTIEHGGAQAYYSPLFDSVKLPQPTGFTSPEEYYATLFHELAHSTGHSKRLNRGLDSHSRPFGSPDYGKEELVAEMAAAYLCGQAGIRPAVIENQAAYISGWLSKLRHDKKLIVAAAGAGQKAADWIQGERKQAE